MVHAFAFDDKYYLYDTGSGSLHECDFLTSEVIKKKNGENYNLSNFSEKEIKETEDEIQSFVNNGLLYKEEIKELPLKSDTLKAVCIHISHDCNLRCKYCFADEGAYKGKRQHMPVEIAKKAIDFLIKNSGNRKILEADFFGGEPLMNFDAVKETVYYAREKEKTTGKKFLFTLTTNGVLLDDEKIEFLNEQMENVVISLDGRKETNDAIRQTVNGKGSFDIIYDKFRHFVETRGDKSYYVRGTFTSKNLDFSEDCLFLADSGFKHISLEPVVLSENDSLAITEKNIPQLQNEYRKLAREYLKRYKDGKGFNFFHFNVDLEGGPCLKKRISACGAGNEYLSVTPDGSLYPCHQFAGNKKYLMGNVFDGEIDEDLRKVFKEANLYTKEKCKTCFAKFQCSGGCVANNINFNGDINKPYGITCELFKTRTECAMHILSEKKNMEKQDD